MSGFRVFPVANSDLWSVVSPGYSKALYKASRAIPGMRWGKDEGVNGWVGYSDAVSLVAEDLKRQKLRFDSTADSVTPIDPNAPSLFTPSYADARDYQREGIDWVIAHAREGCILAFDLGLGKTLVALRAARALKVPALVVCPAFITGIWGGDDTSEVKKWWRDAWPPRVLEGLKPGPWAVSYDDAKGRSWYWRGQKPVGWTTSFYEADTFPTQTDAEAFAETKWSADERARLGIGYIPAPLPPALLTVCNYSILHAWAPHLTGAVKTLVADEAHYISNSKTLRSGALAALAGQCHYRIALTGTPLTNRPKDLHNLVNTICPGRFGTFASFGIRYADGHKEEVPQRGGKPNRVVWKFDGASNLDELKKRLEFFMLRKTKEDVGIELPPRTLQTILLDVKKSFVAPPRSILNESANAEKAFRRAMDLAADGKLPQVVSLVASHIKAGHNVVVFCWRRQIARMLREALQEETDTLVEVIHGEIPLKARQRAIAADWRGLVATIDVTAGGISLTRGDVGVYAELTWEPHEILQTMGRLYRPGQTKPTLFQVAIARGTIDEIVARELLAKDSVLQQVLGGGDTDLAKALAETKKKDTKTQLRSLLERLRKMET